MKRCPSWVWVSPETHWFPLRSENYSFECIHCTVSASWCSFSRLAIQRNRPFTHHLIPSSRWSYRGECSQISPFEWGAPTRTYLEGMPCRWIRICCWSWKGYLLWADQADLGWWNCLKLRMAIVVSGSFHRLGWNQPNSPGSKRLAPRGLGFE